MFRRLDVRRESWVAGSGVAFQFLLHISWAPMLFQVLALGTQTGDRCGPCPHPATSFLFIEGDRLRKRLKHCDGHCNGDMKST